MSRNVTAVPRNRQLHVSTNRGSRMKPKLNDTYPRSKKNGGPRYGVTLPKNKRTTKQVANATISASSSAEESSADELDQEADDDEDNEEPEVLAPSRSLHVKSEAGRFQYDQSDDNLSEAGDWNGFPVTDLEEPVHSIERDEDFEKRLFESDDDLIYEKVNEVSDSDDDEDAVEQAETELLIGEFEFDESGTDQILNSIEGMSAYGFGNESDLPLSSQSSDDAIELVDRHVRFEEVPAIQQAVFTSLSESPTMTRALLPSALPDSFVSAATDAPEASGERSDEDDGYDSMLLTDIAFIMLTQNSRCH